MAIGGLLDPSTASFETPVTTLVPEDPDPDVRLGEFFSPDFMAEYTRFESFSAFCAASPWAIEGREDLDDLPSRELDRYVARTTQFESWVAMRNRAAVREIRERFLW